MEVMEQGLKVRGFYRVQIENPEDGSLAGDSGWNENQVTNDGFLNYLVKLLGAISGSSQIGYVGLGTGTVPGATATTLHGEVTSRTAVTAASSNSSKAVRFTATFSSAGSFVGSTVNLQNIGLFATNTGGTLFAGNTYATSSCATNQNVNVTYDITFS